MPRARFLVIALLSWLAPPCHAQSTLTAAEYFFDADPGVGNATSLTSFTASGNIDFNFSAAASGLNAGMHILAIRVKDNTNAWSIPSYSSVYVLNNNPLIQEAITSAEYFFDTDPGSGNGTVVPGISSGALIDVTYQANASALAAGFHLLSVRTKNINGQWGTPSFSSFYILNGSIVNLEYYIDTDPGTGIATQVSVPPSSSIDMDVIIPSASLTAGPHTLGLRASPIADMWGTTLTTAFIVKDSQAITFSSLSAKTFGDAPFDLTATTSSGLTITYTSSNLAVVTISGATVTIIGAGATTVTASQAGDGTYFPAADNPQTLTVNKANQTIAFSALPTKTVSDPDFTLSATTGSGLPMTYTSSNLAVATISGNTVTILGAGTTDITATQTGDSNYNAAADVVQTLTVTKADQTITFSALPAKTLGDADFALSASASSGLPVSFVSSNLSVATISGNTVTIVGGGTTNITASQAGNVFYNAAADVVQPQLVQVSNSPPSLTTSAIVGFYVSGDVVVNNALVVADTDGNLQSALVSITTGHQSAEDQLVFTNQNGISGTFNTASGALTLTGTTSVANYQAALRTVVYRNAATSPNTADRTITFQVNDGTVASNIVTSTITINKPPAITVTPQITQAGGNIVFLVSDILSDPDNNLDLTTLTIVSAQGATITIAAGIITIDYSSVADYEGTDQLTITVCDQGGKCKTENVSIEVGAEVEVFNGISANGDGANDYLRIRYLRAGTKVFIYNRWGDSVYEMEDYDNNDPAKRFEGFNNSGNELTSGTYFYKVSLPDGKQRTGYLHLKR